MLYSATTGGFYDPAIHATLPHDAVVITEQKYTALLSAQGSGQRIVPGPGGHPIAQDRPPPTPGEIRPALTADVYARLNRAAQDLGYDDIRAAVSYADEPAVPRFQAEGRAMRRWRSLVWSHCYAVLDDVQAGLRPIPSAPDLLAELPDLVIVYPPDDTAQI